MKVLVFSHEKSSRLSYTLDLVFQRLLGMEYELTSDIQHFGGASTPKFSYAPKQLVDEPFIQSHEILFQRRIVDHKVAVGQHKDLPVLFAGNNEALLPYDPLAAIFYLTVRYEEYLPFVKDNHGRFKAVNSIAHKSDFLEIPIVHYYAQHLLEALEEKFGKLATTKRSFEYTPTYDIDSAYAYRHKGLIRTLGGYAKSLITLEISEITTRLKVLLGAMKDPFDNFEWLHNLHKTHKLKPMFFFLLGDYAEYDKNIGHEVPKQRALIKDIDDRAAVGIHPSYDSNESMSQLTEEVSRLSNIVNRKVKNSRQHFLKLSFPQTYQRLLSAGIHRDYTMGYAECVGFRASICIPYPFFDLERNEQTELIIHPFAIMDATFQYYLKISSDDAMELMLKLAREVKKVDGHLYTLFHNSTFEEGSAWRKCYSSYLDELRKLKDAAEEVE